MKNQKEKLRNQSNSLTCVWLFLTYGVYSPWNSLGWNTGVGGLSLFQGIFPTQGSDQDLLHCRWILYQLSCQGSWYTNSEKSEREIKESITFTIATKRIKYLGINLSKETKELYMKNYKTLMKEIKDDISRWRDIPCSWVGGINIVKIAILANAICRFNVAAAAATAKSLQSSPTLCDRIDGSPPGSSVYGIFQPRILEWSAIAFPKIQSSPYQITNGIFHRTRTKK